MIPLPPRSPRTSTLFPSPTLFRSPRRLPCHRIGIGVAVAVLARRQQFRDDVVQQKALAEFRRVLVEVPGTATLADRVPGPDGVGIYPVHQLDRKSTRLNSSH